MNTPRKIAILPQSNISTTSRSKKYKTFVPDYPTMRGDFQVSFANSLAYFCKSVSASMLIAIPPVLQSADVL